MATSESLANAQNPTAQLNQGMLPGFGSENAGHSFVSGKPRQGKRSHIPPAAVPRTIQCRVSDLRPWPGFEKARKPLAPQKLYAMAEAGEAVFREPIQVSPDGIILDGYARWILAQKQGRKTIYCIERVFQNEEEALRFLLQRHTSHSDSLTPFSRVVLALELRPVLRERARENQRTRGSVQLPSKLTKDEAIDVRQEIARLAQVSTGNVTKVVQTLRSACPELLAALRQGEASIHRAHQWSKFTTPEQQKALSEWRSEKDILPTIRRLLSRHRSKPIVPLTAADLIRRLAAASDEALGGIELHIMKYRGRRLVASEELLATFHTEPPASLRQTHGSRGQLNV